MSVLKVTYGELPIKTTTYDYGIVPPEDWDGTTSSSHVHISLGYKPSKIELFALPSLSDNTTIWYIYDEEWNPNKYRGWQGGANITSGVNLNSSYWCGFYSIDDDGFTLNYYYNKVADDLRYLAYR